MTAPSERAVPFYSVLSSYAKGLVRDTLTTCLPDAEESVEETLQLFNDGLLLLCTVSTAEAGDRRHQPVNIRACRFDRAVTERALHKAASLIVFQVFLLNDCNKLPFFSSATKVRHSSITSDTSLIPAMKVSISAFLLRSSGLASTAFWIVMRISLSSQCESWYFCTRSRM